MDEDRLERFLDQLATPLSRYQTARATLARLQLNGERAPIKRLTGAVDATNRELLSIHELIMSYAAEEVQPTDALV
jgi:hypothetical protein